MCGNGLNPLCVGSHNYSKWKEWEREGYEETYRKHYALGSNICPNRVQMLPNICQMLMEHCPTLSPDVPNNDVARRKRKAWRGLATSDPCKQERADGRTFHKGPARHQRHWGANPVAKRSRARGRASGVRACKNTLSIPSRTLSDSLVSRNVTAARVSETTHLGTNDPWKSCQPYPSWYPR